MIVRLFKFAQLHIYKMFRQFYSLFCYFQTPITESFGQQIHISMPCPAFILIQKKEKPEKDNYLFAERLPSRNVGFFRKQILFWTFGKRDYGNEKNRVEETIAAVEM